MGIAFSFPWSYHLKIGALNMEHEKNLKFAVAKGVVGLALGTLLLAIQSLASPLQEQSNQVIVSLDTTAPLANRSGHAAAIYA